MGLDFSFKLSTSCIPANLTYHYVLLFSCPVLAVGYSNGCVSLLDVEDGHCLHEPVSVGKEITTLLLLTEQEKGTSDSSPTVSQDRFE